MATASAATVNMVSNVSGAPTVVAFTPYTYTFTVANNGPGAATNAQFSAVLQNMFNVSVTGVTAAGGATCPAVGAITATGTGVSAVVPSMPNASSCTITVSGNFSQAQTVQVSANIQPGAGDTEATPADNTSVNNFPTVSNATVDVSSTVVINTPPNLPGGFYAYGVPIQFTTTHTNNSGIDIQAPASAQFGSGISLGPVNYIPLPTTGIVTTFLSCTASDGSACPANTSTTQTVTGTWGTPAGGSSAVPYLGATNAPSPSVWKAGVTYTVVSTAIITPAQCADSAIFNARGDNGITVLVDSNPGNDQPTAAFTMDPAQTDPCVVANAPVNVSKTIVNAPAGNVLNANGQTITYHYHVDRPATGDPVMDALPLNYHLEDFVQAFGNALVSPVTTPQGWQVTVPSVVVGACTGTGGVVCPWANGAIIPTTTNLGANVPAQNLDMAPGFTLAVGQGLDFELTFTFANFDQAACLHRAGGAATNFFTVATTAPLPPGYDRWGSVGGSTSVTAFLSPIAPACRNMAASKVVSSGTVHAGEPVSFQLDAANVTGSAYPWLFDPGRVTATDVVLTDVLPSTFTATAVSCSIVNPGTPATETVLPASVGLGNIVNGTFSVTIPSIAGDGLVRCMVTGVDLFHGSQTNTAEVKPGASGSWVDIVPTNNQGTANYQVSASQLVVTKVVSGNTAGYTPGTTFPIDVACTRNGVVLPVQSVNVLPGTPVVVNVPPTNTTESAVCTVTEGTVPAANGFAWNAPVYSPAQTQPTLDIAQTFNATITNVLVGIATPQPDTGNGNAGTPITPINVLTNDTTDGQPSTPTNSTLTVVTPASNPGVVLDPATGMVTTTAAVPPGTYTITYQLCDTGTPVACATSTVTVTIAGGVNPQPDTGSGTAGTPITPVNTLANDTTDGQPSTPTNSTLTVVTPASDPGVVLNPATGMVTTTAAVPPGTYTITYQLCDKLTPPVCATTTVTVTIAGGVNPQPDTGSGTAGTPITPVNVLANDTTDGQPSTPTNSTLTVVTPASNPGVVLDPATGMVTTTAATPAGTYTITYQLCDKLTPPVCATTTVTVTIAGGVNPQPDTGSGTAGTPITPVNVLANDTTDGQPSTPTNSTLTVVTPASNPGVVLNPATGMVTTTAAVPPGTYTITYQLCDKLTPPVCATTTATVTIAGGVSPQADTGSGTAGTPITPVNVLGNDTTNGQPSTLTNSTLAVVTPASNPGVVLDPATGKVTTTATVPPGTYTITYKLCDKATPPVCATTTVTVTIAGGVNPQADTASGTAGTPITPVNVLGNDTTDGQPSTPTNSTLTVVTPASDPGVVLDPATGMVTTTATVPAGTYTITYQLCNKATPAVCATATVTVTVAEKGAGKATNVPTLSEYGLMIMGGLLMVFGMPYMRRRRK
ncbi:IPTL-CTERM sorting domain-containing protein [Comamonas odontotermitis]|uniref:IPTL-CTERM sorting domain-containing protein n=1 Tax=Comamonas odontotermitis TaxID=379895 RepID=UPI0037518F75